MLRFFAKDTTFHQTVILNETELKWSYSVKGAMVKQQLTAYPPTKHTNSINTNRTAQAKAL